MKRERTKDYDVIRQSGTISIVELKSGCVAASFGIPSEDARLALIKILSDPLETVTPSADTTQAEPVEATAEKKTTTTASTTKKRTTKTK